MLEPYAVEWSRAVRAPPHLKPIPLD